MLAQQQLELFSARHLSRENVQSFRKIFGIQNLLVDANFYRDFSEQIMKFYQQAFACCSPIAELK